ncbi:hypothetical protein [Schleiferilactobacillus perolens]|jgi:hypothetical protein|uniref:hypothetical protein n=1 Tax=Schleiferilactobacillus perolens TaxID=100468 RepID=UPI0023526C36|nr:hypothetical protein [Schleiferilactobacillus perolens]MCI2170663.1 hypothetical protein [Schleiferilactobacillus perolens]
MNKPAEVYVVRIGNRYFAGISDDIVVTDDPSNATQYTDKFDAIVDADDVGGEVVTLREVRHEDD